MKALIVIDAQEDFTRGTLRNEEAIRALPIIHDVVEFAKANKFYYIMYTQDTHFENYFSTLEGRNLPYSHCIYGETGRDLCPEVITDYDKVIIIPKNSFGTLAWKDWDLTSLDEIWLCGFCTDICVSANFQILKAQFPEIPITVISDACAGVTPELHNAALKIMQSCQANIKTWGELKCDNLLLHEKT